MSVFSKMNKILIWLILLIFLLFGCTSRNVTDLTTQATSTTEEAATTLAPDTCDFNIDVEVSNLFEQINPQYFMCVASGTNPNNQFTADGICLSGFDMVAQKDGLPSIRQEAPMALIIDQDTSVQEITVYDDEGELIDTWEDWSSRQTLSSGEYFIRLALRNNQDDCWVEGYAFFVMTVLSINEDI